MKTKKLMFTVAVLFIATTLFAQTETSRFALELNGIKNEYHGDYGSGLWDFKSENFQFGGGLNLSMYLNSSFNLGLGGSFGGYGYKYDDPNRFLLRKADYDLHLDYKFNNGYLLKKTAKFYPFLTAGVGLAHYNASMHDTPYPDAITKGVDFIIPLGAGLKYQITNGFALQYKYLYNFTNQDIRDENRGAGKPFPNELDGNDRFGKHVFSVIFSFGKKDSDKDGVSDKYDLCPDTPKGVKVDKHGCPIDSDGDGVPDYLDKCPNTPAGVSVDANGCPVDSDGDGIPDYLDKCPNTPKGVAVDADGCPVDSDGDGIPDYLDKCPNTPKGVAVDADGCPVDSDGDGIPDYLDKCPDTPKGVAVDADGCPVDVEEEIVLPEAFEKGVQFALGSSVVRTAARTQLDEIAAVLNENPSLTLEIGGHADITGEADYNMVLSESRADTVKRYLVSKGVDESRISTVGYGVTQPIADNETLEGRAQNRRVDFKVEK